MCAMSLPDTSTKILLERMADLEMTVTGPVAMPFGDDGSGIRLAEVTADGVQHRYYDFGRMPDRLSIK